MHVHGRSGRAYVQVCGKSSGKARPARARAYARVSAAEYNLPLTVFTTGRALLTQKKTNTSAIYVHMHMHGQNGMGV